MKLQTGTFAVLPPGIYTAECTGAEIMDSEWGKNVKLTYRTTVDGEERRLTTWAKLRVPVTAKAKLAKVFAAHFGRQIQFDPPEDLDTDDLVGCRVQLLLDVESKDGADYNKVTGFSAVQRSAAAIDDGDPYVKE